MKVDVLARQVLCVEPKREFVPLLRQVEDLEEGNGCFYIKGGLGPAVERFLRIYAEIAQQVTKRKAGTGQERRQVS